MSYAYCDYPPRGTCYPPSYAPMWPPAANPLRETGAAPHARVPSIAEQMGTDPISKLAAAIEKLADALKGEGNRD
jgi:hypothetical protein